MQIDMMDSYLSQVLVCKTRKDLQCTILYNCTAECGLKHGIRNWFRMFRDKDRCIGYEHSSFLEGSLYSKHIRVCTNCKDHQRSWWDRRN